MIEYPKTRNLNKRDGARMLDGTYQLPEAVSVDYWQAHEKIDGTNCRLDWRIDPSDDPLTPGLRRVSWGGRTDNAQLHSKLYELLNDTVRRSADAMFEKIESHGISSITVFAEGIGPKIQGNLYKLTEHALVAFDVLIDDRTFLPQDAVDEYAELLGIRRAPRLDFLVGDYATTWVATAEAWLDNEVREGFPSSLNPDTRAEGLILRPLVELRTQGGERVQIKLKTRDYAA